jgi:demethylmenaquinone methyltransferase/2-methoxy-6-polyprenyl-1,4-benzoquinol methylase
MTDRRATRANYDRLARGYDWLAEPSEGPLRRQALQLLAPRSGEAVLEIGCGTGRGLADLAAAGANPLGVDISFEMARRCLARRRIHPGGVVCADGIQLPLADRTFEAAFLSFSLELFPPSEIPTLLGETRRVLRPGGRLGVVGMSDARSGPMVSLYRWAHAHFPAAIDCQPMNIRLAVHLAGFEITQHRVENLWGLPIELLLAQ